MSIRNSGFTLVEVMASVGAFTIAFLIGFSAIGSFMIRQDMNFQRTVAANAAVLLVERHAYSVSQMGSASAAASTMASMVGTAFNVDATHDYGCSPYLRLVSVVTNVKFKGGEYKPGDKVCVFRQGLDVKSDSIRDFLVPDPLMSDPSSINGRVNLGDYQNLIVTFSPQSNPEADTGIKYRIMSMWYGFRDDVVANQSTTVEFLGRYLVADELPVTP